MAILTMEQEQCEAGFCHATQYGKPLAECKAAAGYTAMGC